MTLSSSDDGGKIQKTRKDVKNANITDETVMTIQSGLGTNLKDLKAFDRNRQLGNALSLFLLVNFKI